MQQSIFKRRVAVLHREIPVHTAAAPASAVTATRTRVLAVTCTPPTASLQDKNGRRTYIWDIRVGRRCVVGSGVHPLPDQWDLVKKHDNPTFLRTHALIRDNPFLS